MGNDKQTRKAETMTTKITLKNNYHNTSVRINAGIGSVLTPSQCARARRELCGCADCKCGGIPTVQTTDNGQMVFVDAVQINGKWTYEISGSAS